MKKSILTAILAGVMLLSGCSGVSEESYNSVVAENEKLKSENSKLESKSNSLQEENNTSNSDELKDEDYYKKIAINIVDCMSKNLTLEHKEDLNGINWQIQNDKSNGKVYSVVTCKATDNRKIAECICAVSNNITRSAFFLFQNNVEKIVYIFKNNESEISAIGLFIIDSTDVSIEISSVNINEVTSFKIITVDKSLNTDIKVILNDQSTSLPDTPSPIIESNGENNGSSTSQPSTSSNNTQSSPSQPTQPTVPSTTGEKNALKKAQLYLNTMAFSRNGLIEQLEYEGFSKSEAIYGADNVGANWNEQAAKKAKSYLDIMPFSRESLIEQLEYEGFTHDQAVYGAAQNGY